MIRSILFYPAAFFLFAWIASSVRGQDVPLPTEELINPRLSLPPRVTAGIIIGPNIFSPVITHNPTAVYSNSPEGEFVQGFQAGLRASMILKGKASLFADARFISSTAKYLVESGNYTDEFAEDMNFISIPVGALYMAGAGGIKYYPMAGIAFDYLMFSDLSYNYHPYPNEYPYTESGGFDITFERHRLHFNAILGLGFRYQVKDFFLGLEISYMHGLRNYIDTDDMKTMQVYYGSSLPFKFQSPGFRTQGILVNIVIQKPGK